MQPIFIEHPKKKPTAFIRSLRKAKLVIVLLCLVSCNIFAQKPTIISFGWDYPDVAQMSKKLDSMQNTPFDGICFSFHNSIMEAFDSVSKSDAYFQYDKLSSLKWGRYRDNFIILRGYSRNGVNWFDDKAWVTITQNMMGVSKAMLTGKVRGILFDAEYYLDNKLYNPWTYNKTQYPDLSFEEVQKQVRERGTQFIEALQKYTTDFSFLSIWLASLVLEDKVHNPLENTRQALLIPFIEGILLGKNKNVKVIDGNENGYWYSKPTQFLESVSYLKKNTTELMQLEKGKQLAKEIQTAQPIFYDGILARHASFERGFATADKWRWLEENLKYALATSTSNIVWFYYERVNWWKDKVNDTLVSILQNCKKPFISDINNKTALATNLLQPKCYNINTGEGYYYLYNDPKKPMNTGSRAFLYTWDAKKKLLKLRYEDKAPVSVSVFVNNTLFHSLAPTGMTDTIKVKTFTKGTLAILAKYADNNVASGLQVN